MKIKLFIIAIFCCSVSMLEAGKEKSKVPSIKTNREGSGEGSRASCNVPVQFTPASSPRTGDAPSQTTQRSSDAKFYTWFACFICCCGVKTVDEHQHGYDTIK